MKPVRILMIMAAVMLLEIFIPQAAHTQTDDVARANALNSEISRLRKQGQYAESLPLAREHLALVMKIRGLTHADVAPSAMDLGDLYTWLGNYTEAEKLYNLARGILEKAYGANHARTGQAYHRLGNLYILKGDYQEAEVMLHTAKDLYLELLGPDHRYSAEVQLDFARLSKAMGQYRTAEALFLDVIKTLEKIQGKDHVSLAGPLRGLASVYAEKGGDDYALKYLDRAYEILKKYYGPEHPNVAICMSDMASCDLSAGRLKRAEARASKALRLLEKAFGRESPNLSNTLFTLASIDYVGRDYNRSLKRMNRVLDIGKKSGGDKLASWNRHLGNAAYICAARREYEKAYDLYGKAHAADDRILKNVIAYTSEERKLRFLASRRYLVESSLSLVFQHLARKPEYARGALNLWLRRKGVALEAQSRLHEGMMTGASPKARRVFDELVRVRSRLSRLAFGAAAGMGSEEYNREILELEAKRDTLLIKLSRLNEKTARYEKTATADVDAVARALPEGAVLVELARIDLMSFKYKGGAPGHYLAFILPAASPKKLHLLDLGKAEPIDLAVAAFKSSVIDLDDPAGKKAIDAARRLHDLVFAPIIPFLGGSKDIYLSPDGQLNLMPFEVFQGPDGRFLIEDYAFTYLNSGRELLGFDKTRSRRGKCLLIGSPDFDLSPTEKAAALRRLGLKRGREAPPAGAGGGLRGLYFDPLPETKKEIEAIYRFLGPKQAVVYSGREAVEEVLAAAKSPEIVHLATHGFFLSDSDLKNFINPGLIRDRMDRKKVGDRLYLPGSPLLRSGLALAGANHAARSKTAGAGDGLLTAEKVLSLNLNGTGLVVLSACQTGLGDVHNGEGVYGLRRAFILAGARSLVMSMWPVPDRETRELMTAFYRNMMEGGMPRNLALREAVLAQMRTVQERYGHTHPLFWGAFVFMGQP